MSITKNNNKPSQKTKPEIEIDYRSIDGRQLHRSTRTVQFANKVTPEFDKTIRRLAYEEHCLIVDMLEKFMIAYLEKKELEKQATKAERKNKSNIKKK